jgi:hypothetical protein
MLRCEAARKGRVSVDVPFTFDPFPADRFAGPFGAPLDLIRTAGAPEPVSGYDVADTGARMRQDHDI